MAPFLGETNLPPAIEAKRQAMLAAIKDPGAAVAVAHEIDAAYDPEACPRCKKPDPMSSIHSPNSWHCGTSARGCGHTWRKEAGAIKG